MSEMLDTRQIVEIVLYALMFLIGGGVNVSIIVFFLFKSKREDLNSYHFIMAQLSLSDLTVCLGIPVVEIQYTMERWYSGEFLCKASSVPYSGSTVSCWILCGLAYDRYRKIKDPMAENFSKMRISLCCLMVWVTVFLITTPQFLRTEYHANSQQCYFDPFQSFSLPFAIGYHAFYFIINVVLPLTVFVVLYTKAHKCLLSNSPNLNGQAGEAIATRNKSALKTLKMLIVLYAVCIIPGSLFGLVFPLLDYMLPWFNTFAWSEDGLILYFCYTYGFCLNSVANCVIYAGRTREFRSFLLKPFGRGETAPGALNNFPTQAA